MKVLGVDPGSFSTGWGLVERRGGRVHLIDSGVIRTKRTSPFAQRLCQLHDGLSQVLASFEPDAFAIESVFHAHHARSALQLGHARGVLVLAAAQAGLAVAEYPPATVKKAVTGNGAAAKDQVRQMVGSLLGTTIEGAMDRSDALAVAICHAHSADFSRKLRAGPDKPSGTAPRPTRKVKG